MEIIWDSLPRMMSGALLTMELTILSVVFGLCLAVPLAMLYLAKNPVLSLPVRTYVFYFRGTPLLVQIFLIYYGSGQFRDALEAVGLWTFFREPYFCAVLSLTLNTAAYTAYILRGAITNVPFGEVE
ncbi:MAG: ABC transporter permease subunit, partial [Alphaproteobacteria bacterium]